MNKFSEHSISVVQEIRAVSDSKCVIELEEGTYRFDRFCPHAGADLSKVGYYNRADNTIRCGWHNLPFDLQTGLPPCAAVEGINMEKLCD